MSSDMGQRMKYQEFLHELTKYEHNCPLMRALRMDQGLYILEPSGA